MASISLEGPSVVAGGLKKVSYPVPAIDFRAEINNLLIQKGFVDRIVPLEELHLHLRPEDRVATAFNNVTEAFYETNDQFRQIYFSLMKYIAQEIFDFDFIFQATPTIRFHFPGPYEDMYRSKDGKYLGYHVDGMNGHPMEEINCWLPATSCYESNALQIASLEDGIRILNLLLDDINYNEEIYLKSGFDLNYMKLNSDPEYLRLAVNSCKPLSMKYGELLVFDPRCVHSTAENQEKHTRVSLDFRLIPVEAYDKLTREYKSQGRSGRMFARGDIFYQSSVREL